MIRTAKNGCSSDIFFKGKKVYYDWEHGIPFSSLGTKLDKTAFLKNLVDENNLEAVENMLADWDLHENGWHVIYPDGGYKNQQLFLYLSQIGRQTRPEALDYFN
jgi:hypothetical protein